MLKIAMSLTMLSTLYASGCAQTPDDGTMTHSAPAQTTEGEKPETMTSFTATEYWVKKPGTLVYNGAHDITRSLRLQPKVTVHKEVDGWGLISLEKDEWVKLSDVTLAQPAGVLAGPQESNERPVITVDDMLKAHDERKKP